jgi:predicted RNase H-like HicB family nuclease
MKTLKSKMFSLVAILVEDPTLGGYTAFFKQFPNIISEGETEDEAIQNLLNAIHDVFSYQSQQPEEAIRSGYKVIEKSVGFCAEACC